MEIDKAKIWWYDDLYESFYKDANITKFNLGRKLFNKRAITYLSIEENEVEACVYDGKKHTYESKITFNRLSYNDKESLLAMIRDNIHLATDLLNGNYHKEFDKALSGRSIEMIPSWNDIKFRCTCKKAKKCEHVSTVLHRIFNETIYEPMLIFSLRGIHRKDIFSIILNDPDFEPSELRFPEELTMENYEVKSSRFDNSSIDTLIYYGKELPVMDFKLLKNSVLTTSSIFHGKMRDEFYDIYYTITDLVGKNVKKY